MIVVAIIGILAAIAIPLYANVQARARIAKAQADARALASAVSMYRAHMGNVAAALTDLRRSRPTSASGRPVHRLDSDPPAGWQAYTYAPNSAAGTFNISASGDGTTVSLP